MDLKAETKYTLEVTPEELFVVIKGLSKLAGEPGRNRDDAAYKALAKFQDMVGFIERCEKAMDTAVNPEPETEPDRSEPVLPPIPAIPGPAAPLGDDSEHVEAPRGAEGAPKPPVPPMPTDRPLHLPPSILPPGPPPAPPKKGSTKKSKKTKKKAKS